MYDPAHRKHPVCIFLFLCNDWIKSLHECKYGFASKTQLLRRFIMHSLIHFDVPFLLQEHKRLQISACVFYCLLRSVQSCITPQASADEYVFHFPERSWQRSNVSVQSMTQRVRPALRRAAPTQPCWPSFDCSGKQRLRCAVDRLAGNRAAQSPAWCWTVIYVLF